MDLMGGSKFAYLRPDPMPIDLWIELVTTCLQGQTLASTAMCQELTGYRLETASHCKKTNTPNEHEFVIYEFGNDQKQKLELCTERAAGQRTHSRSSSVDSFPTESEESSSSHPFSSPKSSRSSLSLESMKGSIPKASGFIRQAVRRLSDSSLCRPSGISSNLYLAADTINRISCRPPHSQVLRTVTFSGDRSLRPSLWDLMALLQVIHQESTTYTLLGRQCYWFADTIFGSLEMWARLRENGIVTAGGKRKARWWSGMSSTGTLGVVPVYRRDAALIEKIWEGFMKERQVMSNKREAYERRSEEIRNAERLAGQVTELKSKQVTERQEREKERQAWDERERRLRKEQGERELQLRREQEERERQLREEQEETVRHLQKEQRLLKQQIVDQQRQLEEKNPSATKR